MSVATVPRSERIAPDVTAIHGAEAVAIVRAGGFIAAIESLASELAQGTVVEQEPLAGALSGSFSTTDDVLEVLRDILLDA